MNEEKRKQRQSDDKVAAYRYLQDPGVNTCAELEEFKERFSNCKDMLIVWTFARLVYEKHGVRILGF